MTEGFSVADALALQNRDGYGDGMFGGGSWWAIMLFFLLAWGRGGFGFGNNDGALQGALTRSDMCQEFGMNDIKNGIRGIERGICDLGYASLNQTNQLGMQIAESRFAAQQCCCETNRNIDALRFQSERNTCDIVNAIRTDGEATRALINANTMQDLRDKLADRDRELQTANFQLSQQAQTANIIDTLQPTSKPAYITCSPYQSAMVPYGLFGENCGNGFGCGCN